jgi:hypothetical protein
MGEFPKLKSFEGQSTSGRGRMKIAGTKGKRREVRRMPAQRSPELLGRYRRGEAGGREVPAQEGLAGE